MFGYMDVQEARLVPHEDHSLPRNTYMDSTWHIIQPEYGRWPSTRRRLPTKGICTEPQTDSPPP